jgi:predicted RNase H-like nuclease (RuvC/YqgF family)
MTLDHFNNLSEDERAKYLQGCEALEASLKDSEAEIKSLKDENETYKTGTEKLEADLKTAKELNFTLARKVDSSKDQPTFDDILHSEFGKKKGANK